MRTRRGLRVMAVAAVVVVGASAAAAAIVTRTPDHEAAATPQGFRVQGRVRGLYPGATKMMRVRIRNPHPFPIRVRSLKIGVLDASPGCRARTLVVGRTRSLRAAVPARRGAKVLVPVRMRPGAPPACMGARYPLAFSGKAVRA